jgi:hypothetical protein
MNCSDHKLIEAIREVLDLEPLYLKPKLSELERFYAPSVRLPRRGDKFVERNL